MITVNEDVNSALSHPQYNKKYKGLNIQYSSVLNYLYVPYKSHEVIILYILSKMTENYERTNLISSFIIHKILYRSFLVLNMDFLLI